MSRIIYLRSPYFIKASASEGKTLTSAQLDLYVWKGDLTDAPTEPTRSLQKSTEDSGNNYVTFEVSEICRDELNVNFNGITRDSEPIYINTELTQTYSDGTSEIYSNIVFGLDGYRDFSEGPQVTENLFKDPSEVETIDEDDNLVISISDSSSGMNDREFKTGSDITITATFLPSDATLQWFRNTVEIAGETNATLTITAADTDNEGTYFCRAYLNEGLATETSEDSNDIYYLLQDCPDIYFNPDAQGSSYLSAGGEKGTTISIEILYNTDCYTELVADDVVMANGDGSPFTITSVTTADQGVDKLTTVLLTTKGKNIGAANAKRDRVIIRYYDIRKKLTIPKGINVQQIAAAGSIRDISWIGKPETDFLATDAEFIISGEVGARYEILVLPKYYDRDNDGKITDEQDYEWISESALDSITGVIEADGQNNHTISLTQNNLAYQRTFNLVAVNLDDASNRAVGAEYTQDNVLDFAHLQLSDIEFTGESEEDMTLTYFSNADVELRITRGADGFRLIQPGLSDPGPPEVVFEEEKETSVLYRGPSALAGSEVTVRCRNNNGSAREGRVSIRYRDSGVDEASVALLQPGTDDFCIFQSFIVGPGNRVNQDTFTIDASRTGGALGYFIEVNSSVPFTITVPSGIAVRRNIFDPIAYGANVSGVAGNYGYSLFTEDDNPNLTNRTFTLTITSDDPDFVSTETMVVTQLGSDNISDDAPLFDSLKLYEATRASVTSDWVITDNEVPFDRVVYGRNILNGYGLVAEASDVLEGDLEYQWYYKAPFNTQPSKVYTSGNTFFFTPASLGILMYQCRVTNDRTGLTRISDFANLNVIGNDVAGIVDWVQSDQLQEDIFGQKSATVLPVGGTYRLNITGIAEDQTWRWQVSDFSTDLKVERDINGNPEEAPTGVGMGPQQVEITFRTNNGGQKFINLGFYDGPASNPNVIVKFNQLKKNSLISAPIIINTPLSNSGGGNAGPVQVNTGGNNTSSPSITEILQDLVDLRNTVGGSGSVDVTPIVNVDTTPNTATNVVTVVDEQNAAGNINLVDIAQDLNDLQRAINEGTLPVLNNPPEEDNGNVKEDVKTPTPTPPVVGGGGGTPKPTPGKDEPIDRGREDRFGELF